MFQLIYARGMFRLQAMPRFPLELFQFIYVRGMFRDKGIITEDA